MSVGRRKHKRQRPSSPCLGCTYEEENGGTSQAISPGWGERGSTPAHHGRRGCRLAPESPSTSPPPTPPTAAPALVQCCDCKEDKKPGDLCDAGCCEDCCDGASCWPSHRQGIQKAPTKATILGGQPADSDESEIVAGDPRQDEVGEELCYQSGAGSLPHMQPFPVENAARSIAPTPRVERVSIAADSPISGGQSHDRSQSPGC